MDVKRWRKALTCKREGSPREPVTVWIEARRELSFGNWRGASVWTEYEWGTVDNGSFNTLGQARKKARSVVLNLPCTGIFDRFADAQQTFSEMEFEEV